MSAAIVIAPYHTNGGYPPLGAAYLNSILREAVSEVQVYDLQYSLPSEKPALFYSLRSALNIGKNVHLVQPILDIRFLLYCLYRHEISDHDWVISNDLREHASCNASERDRLERLFLELAASLDEAIDEYARDIARGRPELVLFSTYISNLLMSVMLSKRLKSLLPGAAVVYGGPGSSLVPVRELILRLGLADTVAPRDGEPVLRELLARRAARGQVDLDLPGLVTLSSEASSSDPPVQLDELALPSFEGFPMPQRKLSDYQKNWPIEYRSNSFTDFMLPVETCRGCNFRCAFCSESAYWSKFNPRTPEAIVRELRHQAQRYDIRTISFNSSLINCNDDWHRELLTLLETEAEVLWWGYYRPTSDLTAEVATKMFRAGCRMVSLGVESFYQPALDAMNKRTTAEEMLEAILILANAGIMVDFALLSGFPLGAGADGAEAEHEANTLALRELKERCADPRRFAICAGHLVRLEPYSSLYSRPERFGISLESDPIDLPAELDDVRDLMPQLAQRWSSHEPFATKLKHGRGLARFVTESFYG